MSKHSGDSGRGKTPFYEEETSGRNWLREGRPPAVTSGERRQEVKKKCLWQKTMFEASNNVKYYTKLFIMHGFFLIKNLCPCLLLLN